MDKKKHHRGTNGGEAYSKKCKDFALSVRFHVELAYLTEKSYSGAARELNRKRIKAMKGGKWFPASVQRMLEKFETIDAEQ